MAFPLGVHFIQADNSQLLVLLRKLGRQVPECLESYVFAAAASGASC